MSSEEPTQTLLMSLPIKGLHLMDDGPLGDLFRSPWSVVGHSQMNALETSLGSSYQSNIRRMRKVAWPTALFLYRYQHPQVYIADAAIKAEYALSALSMAVLLHDWTPRKEEGPVANPRPVFRARYSEYYDEPIGVGKAGVKVVGGGTSVFSLIRPDLISPLRQICLDDLKLMIERAPRVVGKVLNQERLTRRERRLADGMSVINSAFQTLSAGAFVSALVSAAEVLVDSQQGAGTGDYSSPWQRRVARIRSIVSSAATPALDRVLKARHDFVHGGAQPTGDRLPLAALGIAVQVWSVMADLYGRFDNAQDMEAFLDCAAIVDRVSPSAPHELLNLANAVPAGARAQLPWIDFWFRQANEP